MRRRAAGFLSRFPMLAAVGEDLRDLRCVRPALRAAASSWGALEQTSARLPPRWNVPPCIWIAPAVTSPRPASEAAPGHRGGPREALVICVGLQAANGTVPTRLLVFPIASGRSGARRAWKARDGHAARASVLT